MTDTSQQHNNPAPGQHHNSPPSPHSPSSPSSHTHGQPEKKPGHGTPGSSTGGSHTGSPGGSTGTGTGSTGSSGSLPPLTLPLTQDAVMKDMLLNTQKYGFNNTTDGLWINWKIPQAGQPLQTNFNGTGNPDGPGVKVRHDPLVNLRYVHALWMYKKRVNPGDTEFDSEIARYTPIVKAQQGTSLSDSRGWLYDILMDIAALSGDTDYSNLASSQAMHYYGNLTKGAKLAYYKTDANHPQGFYRVDEAVELACAIIQEGARTNNQAMVSAGKAYLQLLFQTSFVLKSHEFLFQVTNVLDANGAVNPSPDIDNSTYTNPSSGKVDKIQGGRVVMGSVAQEAISLLHAFEATNDGDYLSYAQELLDPMTIRNNSLGLWDTKDGGYFAQMVFTGTNANDATSTPVQATKKEAGRQMQMLQAFRIADKHVKSSDYQDTAKALLEVLLTKAYYIPQHGCLYEMSPSWQVLDAAPGKPMDWVTTEAGGIMAEGLYGV